GRGRLFPIGDADALAATIDSLLSNDWELQTVRAAAYEFTRPMIWARVGEAYAKLGEKVLKEAAVGGRAAAAPDSMPRRDSSLPEPSLDHLLRLTDDTGIIQHATFSVPARRTGYCVDDNARALIVALHADRVQSSADARALVTTYLSYLHCSQEAGGGFRNYMSYERALDIAPPSDDCIGRAIWALGVATEIAQDEGCRLLAREMFVRALPHARTLGPRGTAQCILGL